MRVYTGCTSRCTHVDRSRARKYSENFSFSSRNLTIYIYIYIIPIYRYMCAVRGGTEGSQRVSRCEAERWKQVPEFRKESRKEFDVADGGGSAITTVLPETRPESSGFCRSVYVGASIDYFHRLFLFHAHCFSSRDSSRTRDCRALDLEGVEDRFDRVFLGLLTRK